MLYYVQKGNHREHKICMLYVQNSQKWQRMQSQNLQSESGRIKQRFGNEQVTCMCTDSMWVQRG